jgi:hypothetical protein
VFRTPATGLAEEAVMLAHATVILDSRSALDEAISGLILRDIQDRARQPRPTHRATRSTRQRTITRTATTTKTTSVSGRGGGGGSGEDDGPQLEDDPPRPLRPRRGWQARHGRRDDLARALVVRVAARWWRRACTHTGRRAFCRAHVRRPVTGGVR